jgi:hypothetical protein
MECLFLTGTSLESCAAESDGYTPTSFEMKEYCLNSRHILCPFYCAVTGAEYPAKRKGKKFCLRETPVVLDKMRTP